MSWMAAAVIGSAVVGGAVASSSASKASKAQQQSAQQASDSQLQAQRESIDFQQKQAEQARTDNAPWREAGGNALTQLVQRTGQGGDLSKQFGMADFNQDPGYAFRQAEGMKGMTNSAAARGGLLSGAALKASSQYNQNFASNEYGNAYGRFESNKTNQANRLASIAGVGQTAAAQNGQNAMALGSNVGAGMINTGNQIAGNQIGAGNARASGYLAQGNALSGAINQGVSAWNGYNQANAFQPTSAWVNANGGGF